MKTQKHFAATSAVALFAMVSATTVSGANSITFDNKSEKPALVKLVGPTTASVSVENGKTETVSADAGHYYIKVRYGTPGAYVYSKGDEFDVTETATSASKITITLHKVVDGNYGTRSSNEQEFGLDDQNRPSNNSPDAKKETRWASIVLDIVNEDNDKLFSSAAALNIAMGSTGRDTIGRLWTEGRIKATIDDVVRKNGPADTKTRTTMNGKEDHTIPVDAYAYSKLTLYTRVGTNRIDWITAPQGWVADGLRKTAKEQLEKQ